MKKLMYFLTIIVFFLGLSSLNYAATTSSSGGTETFTTTTGYSTTNLVTWNTVQLDKKTIIVKNDGSYSGTLRVRARTTPGGEEKELNEDTIDASDDTIIYLDRYYDRVLIDVKHGDGTTDMIVDWGHGGMY